jgi:hypothetical protein
MAVRFTFGKTPTQSSRVPTETPFHDKGSLSGVSQPWIRHFQSMQAQMPFNPFAVAAALSPLTVDSIHNVLLINAGGGFTVQLGPSKSAPFSFYTVTNVSGGGAITILPNGTDTINGLASLTQTATQWRTTFLIPDGKTNWVAFSIAGGG